MSYDSALCEGSQKPSWVWNPQPSGPYERFSWSDPSVTYNFKASQDSECCPQFEGKLGLSGYVIDTIADVGSVIPKRARHILQARLGIDSIVCYVEGRRIFDVDETEGEDLTRDKRQHNFRRTINPFGHSHLITKTKRLPSTEPESFIKFDNETMKRFGRHLGDGRAKVAVWSNIRFLGSLARLACEVWTLNPAGMEWAAYAKSTIKCCWGRRFAKTDGGLIGLCPADTQTGDEVVLLEGSSALYVLRRVGDDGVLVGECYFHEVMGGEAWDPSRCELLWLK